MARPPQTAHQREDFQTLVVEASKDIMLNEGLDAVSIRRVAKSVGCGPSTLYYYFENRNAILYAIWRSVTQKTDAQAEALVALELSPLEIVQRMVIGSVAYALENPVEYELIFRLEPIIKTPEGVPFLKGYEVLLGAVTDLLKENNKSKALAPSYAQSFWVIIHGAIRLHQDAKYFPLLPASELSERLMQSLFREISEPS